MKKQIFAGILASAMAVTCATAVSAETVSANKTYDNGLVVDGSSGWNSNSSDTFVITDAGVTITFTNEPFIRDKENYSSFVFETVATDKADGVTMIAGANCWTYDASGAANANTVNVPKTTFVTSWGDDWDKYVAGSTGDIELNAKKTAADTVTYSIKFTNGETETYTSVYPDGVPDGLELKMGSDGGKITIKSAVFGGTAAPTEENKDDEKTNEPSTTEAPKPGDTNATTPDKDKNTPDTGIEGVAVVAGLAIVAAGAIVVAKKRK